MKKQLRAPLQQFLAMATTFGVMWRWVAHPDEPIEAARLAVEALDIEERMAIGAMDRDTGERQLARIQERVHELADRWWAYELVKLDARTMSENVRRLTEDTNVIFARRAALLERKAERLERGGSPA